MVTITVEIDDSCEMARVTDTEGDGLEGNFWDFHNGCHGHYHLKKFKGVNSFVQVLKNYYIENGMEVTIIEKPYKYK